MSARTVLRNFVFLFGGQAAGGLFSFLLMVTIARFFGPDGTGQYGIAISVAGFAVAFADFGLRAFTIKEVSAGKGGSAFLSRMVSLRLLLSVGALLVLFPVVPLLGLGAGAEQVILVIGIQQLLKRLAEGSCDVFLARDEAHVSGGLEVLFRTLGSCAAIGVIFVTADFVWALIALAASELLYALVSAVMLHRRVDPISFVAQPSELWKTARRAGHYALSGVVGHVSSRTDVLLVGLLLSTSAAGFYAAAYRLVGTVLLGPAFSAMAMFPLVTRTCQADSGGGRLYQQSVRGIILAGVPGAVGLMWVAQPLVRLLFGPEFEASTPLLVLLAPLVLLVWLAETMAVFLMATNRIAARARHQWRAAGANVLGNLVMIPTLGPVGAAIATVASRAFLVLMYAIELRQAIGLPRLGRPLAVACLGTFGFSVLFALLPPMPLTLMVVVGVIVYSGVLMLFPDVRATELRMLVKVSLPAGKESTPPSLNE